MKCEKCQKECDEEAVKGIAEILRVWRIKILKEKKVNKRIIEWIIEDLRDYIALR